MYTHYNNVNTNARIPTFLNVDILCSSFSCLRCNQILQRNYLVSLSNVITYTFGSVAHVRSFNYIPYYIII